MALALEESGSIETDESLIALTTHFAQVQFRLKQIISAEPEHKEGLLKELEEFAFQGCTKPMTYDTAAAGEDGSTEAQRKMRTELMAKLKTQLEEIEQCAQEATASQLPQGSSDGDEMDGAGQVGGASNSMSEKQKIIIEELRKRFDMQFGDLDHLSTEEVKQNVEKAMKDVVDPIRTKDEYVTQLQNQIHDLERYIAFLQAASPNHPLTDDASSSELDSSSSRNYPTPNKSHDYTTRSHDRHASSSKKKHRSSTSSRPKKVTFAESDLPSGSVPLPSPISRSRLIGPTLGNRHQPVPDYRLSLTQLDGVDCTIDSKMWEWERLDPLGSGHGLGGDYVDQGLSETDKGFDDLHLSLLVMKKTLAVMQVLTLCQCGGSFQCLPRYVADGHRKRYHTALHSLELAVDKIAIITTAINEPGISVDVRVSLETDLHETVSMLLADSLRLLLEHGLLDGGKPVSYTIGCFPAWRNWGKGHIFKASDECAAWKVVKYYYNLKNGKEYTSKPEQLLCSSFAIPLDSDSSMKKTLLSTIHRVDNTYSDSHHGLYDTKWRALICEGFNLCHLSEWFRILATHPSVAEDLFSVTSFLATTGFRPALACLERLKDNPPCGNVQLPEEYYHSAEAFLRE